MVKLFKLIPLKHYENWMKNKSIDNDKNDKNSLKRSVRDIMHSSPVYNGKKQRFEGDIDNTDMDDDEYEENVIFDNPVSYEKPQKGGGVKTDNIPIVLTPDSKELPQYSDIFKIAQNNDLLKNILDDDHLDPSTKLKLLNYFQQKYDSSRVDNEIKKSVSVEAGVKPNILNDIIKDLDKKHHENVKTVYTMFEKSPNISWDSFGNIYSPPFLNQRNLKNIFLILFNKVKNPSIAKSRDVILILNELNNKTVYDFILNKSLLKMTSYIPWNE